MLKKAVAGGIDGLLTNYGLAKQYRDVIGDIGLLIRLDNNSSGLNEWSNDWHQIYDVKDVLQIGADGVMVNGLPGAEPKADFDTMKTVSRIVADCDRYGLVSSAEILAKGCLCGDKDRTSDEIAIACRSACKRGVDFIKTTMSGSIEEYKNTVTANCYRPILLHGGSVTTDRECLEKIRAGLDAGCKGMVMGRNIFEHPQVERMCAAVAKLIHEDCTVDQAMKELK